MPEAPDLKMYNKDIEEARAEVVGAKGRMGVAERLAGPEEAEEYREHYQTALQKLVYLERVRYQLVEDWVNTELNELRITA